MANGFNVVTGAACHGWFPSWTAARDHQLQLARQEIPSTIEPCDEDQAELVQDIQFARDLVEKAEAAIGERLTSNIVDLICDNTDWSLERAKAAAEPIYAERADEIAAAQEELDRIERAAERAERDWMLRRHR